MNTTTATASQTVQCPTCKGDTIPPNPARKEEVGHYCEKCGISWDAERVNA